MSERLKKIIQAINLANYETDCLKVNMKDLMYMRDEIIFMSKMIKAKNEIIKKQQETIKELSETDCKHIDIYM